MPCHSAGSAFSLQDGPGSGSLPSGGPLAPQPHSICERILAVLHGSLGLWSGIRVLIVSQELVMQDHEAPIHLLPGLI